MLKSLVSMCWQGDYWSTHVEVTDIQVFAGLPLEYPC